MFNTVCNFFANWLSNPSDEEEKTFPDLTYYRSAHSYEEKTLRDKTSYTSAYSFEKKRFPDLTAYSAAHTNRNQYQDFSRQIGMGSHTYGYNQNLYMNVIQKNGAVYNTGIKCRGVNQSCPICNPVTGSFQYNEQIVHLNVSRHNVRVSSAGIEQTMYSCKPVQDLSEIYNQNLHLNVYRRTVLSPCTDGSRGFENQKRYSYSKYHPVINSYQVENEESICDMLQSLHINIEHNTVVQPRQVLNFYETPTITNVGNYRTVVEINRKRFYDFKDDDKIYPFKRYF